LLIYAVHPLTGVRKKILKASDFRFVTEKSGFVKQNGEKAEGRI
jgi:hypothetical protein